MRQCPTETNVRNAARRCQPVRLPGFARLPAPGWRGGHRHRCQTTAVQAANRCGTRRKISAARNSRTHRQRRHGRGLKGAAEAARPHRRAENSSARHRRRSRVCRALHPRGQGAGEAESSRHRDALRVRPRGRAVLFLHGIRGRREPAAIAARRPRFAARGAGHRAADLRRAAIRARPGHRPSRHQAGEHSAGPPRPREGGGFRTGENCGDGFAVRSSAFRRFGRSES